MVERSDTISLTEDLEFWAATDTGLVRDHNEDNFLVDRRLNLFVVADGMGGHAAGEVASAIAVNKLREFIAQNGDIIESYRTQKGGVTRKDIINLMEYGVQQASQEIYNTATKYPEKRGMGTTLSALLIVGTRGFIAHVGDSRIYLIRNGKIHQLTEDHSLINELKKRGKVSNSEELRHFPYKNAVTRAVGVYESVQVDILDFDILPRDQFLLATDGLTGYINEPEKELLPYLQEKDIQKIPKGLIDFANARGGKDNITVIVVRVGEFGELAEKLVQEVNLKIDTLSTIPLFQYLSHPELLRVLNVMEYREYNSGVDIITEGSLGDELFVILKGEVEILKAKNRIAILKDGSHVGEMALIEVYPRSATVRTLTQVKVLIMKRKDFYSIIREEPKLATKLLWNFLKELSKRLRETNERMVAFEQCYFEKESLY